MKIADIIQNPSILDDYKSRDEIRIDCHQCEKEFTVQKKKIQVSLKRRAEQAKLFCSNVCVAKSQKTAIEIECVQCHSKFMRVLSQIDKSQSSNRYCSHSCRAIHTNWSIHAKDRVCKGCGVTYRQPKDSGRTSQYCLSCSENKSYSFVKKEGKTKGELTTCVRCSKVYAFDRKKGHTKTTCNSCTVNRQRYERKKKCVEYKGGKCERCSYSKTVRALAFHHVDPSQKDFGISGNHARSWEATKKELDKCILVCHNCHSEIHEELDIKENSILQ